MIIIMRFGENNVLCPKYIYIYEFRGYGGDVHGPPYIFCSLLKKKKKKHDLYLNQIPHHFDSKKILRMNNKKITKRGPQEAPSPIC